MNYYYYYWADLESWEFKSPVSSLRNT